MSLIRRTNPTGGGHALLNVRDEIDRAFDRLFTEPWSGLGEAPTSFGALTPAIDVSETESRFVLEAELPGLTPEDIEVSVTADSIAISGSKEDRAEGDDRRVHRVERRFGAFERRFRLPTPLNPDEVEASFKDGVLRVEVGKAETARARKVRISAN
jgi:HSP20 family protein